MIMQLDKSPGVIIMDKHRYHEKYLLLLHTCNFKKLDYDPTKTTEEKIQRILQKMKKKTKMKQEYVCLYPSGSCPSNFMELQKYTNYFKIAQLMIFYYLQSFQKLGVPHKV